jgi:tight adherence protein C
MIEVALGALLGLGLFVLVAGSSASRLAIQVAPHIRDLSSSRTSTLDRDGAIRTLGLVLRLPSVFIGEMAAKRRRRSTISDELPGALDLIGLCVSAGMSVPTALERIASSGVGEISDECRVIVAEIGLGISVSDALRSSDARVAHEGWSRVIDHLMTARQYGTPLIEIIRALADDEQQAAGRRLLESASAKETLMMFPLVFAILPVTVVMAVFPGLTALGSIAALS